VTYIDKNIISLVDRLIVDMKEYKNKKRYDNEIAIFINYLTEKKLLKSILYLTRDNIDDYFIDCKYKNKLNSTSSLNTHISALKWLFEQLIKHNYNFDDNLGYISTKSFKTKIAMQLNGAKVKELISSDDLTILLQILDNTENLHNTNNYSKLQFVRLYLKLNLLIPLKVTEMLNVKFHQFSEDFRQIEINDITVRIPNSLRIEILEYLDGINRTLGQTYNHSECFFHFLASKVTRKKYLDTGDVSRWFFTAFKAVGLTDYIKDSNSSSFAVERIKKSVIFCLINQGCNLMYLSMLTGLTIDSLIKEYSIDDIDEISESINISLFKTNYYNYL
jgi:hypothetical protein